MSLGDAGETDQSSYKYHFQTEILHWIHTAKEVKQFDAVLFIFMFPVASRTGGGGSMFLTFRSVCACVSVEAFSNRLSVEFFSFQCFGCVDGVTWSAGLYGVTVLYPQILLLEQLKEETVGAGNPVLPGKWLLK